MIINQQNISELPWNLKISKLDNGPEEDEPIGLNIDGRKRSRTGHVSQSTMDADGGLQFTSVDANENSLMEATLSRSDCVVSLQTNLAELALQASQLQ